jgi:hypothetical protein
MPLPLILVCKHFPASSEGKGALEHWLVGGGNFGSIWKYSKRES